MHRNYISVIYSTALNIIIGMGPQASRSMLFSFLNQDPCIQAWPDTCEQAPLHGQAEGGYYLLSKDDPLSSGDPPGATDSIVRKGGDSC